jgi:DNA helicase-2/ATP-dependent DNA helicase PcrA
MKAFVPREGQREILDYEGGLMGVSAVPGSGKTATIVALATRLIKEGRAGDGQVLIVTYQTAAVDNVRSRIRQALEEMGRLQIGYDVRTLHSLSYSIVRANPGLAGIGSEFSVLDDRTSSDLLDKAVRMWNGRNTRVWGALAPGDYYDERWEREWRSIARTIAWTVITTAKNRRLQPDDLLARIASGGGEDLNLFLRVGAEIYQLYQQQVETMGGLDFNDLVWSAVDLLEHHPDLCERLRTRWPIILEDEAQDSVPLQEELLSMLGRGSANWVRVGDPNQAIMSTFTAADPRFLRRFLEMDSVRTVEMSISGRCAPKIIDMANALVQWVCFDHGLAEVRDQAFRSQQIRTTGRGDSQQNPPDRESDIAFRSYNNRVDELSDVARRASLFCRRSPHLTLAILVPTNRLGYEMADVLRSTGADFDEVLQSAHSARKVGETLSAITSFLADPLKRGNLEGAYRAMCSYWPTEEGSGDQERVATLLRSCYKPESLLYPHGDTRPEDALPPVGDIALTDMRAIGVFCRYARRWLRATPLPIDQMLMAVAQDLMGNADMARAQKLAAFLRGRGDINPSWRLPEFARELRLASRGKAASLVEDDDLFTPRPGRISLTTLHKAKGLEWDLVYIVGVDGDWFPYDLDDHFRGEYEFLGGDPGEEARAELLRLIGAWEPGRLSATHMAHVEVIAERMRLLYVAITRARRYLSISWSRDIPMASHMRTVDQAVAFSVLSGINDRRDLGRTG